jgi:CubicO group peptidase (beta-lactamase class C family)
MSATRLIRALPFLAALLVAVVPLQAAHGAAPARAAGPTGVFRADDGGAVYVRTIGQDLYAFAEHPGKNYAFVLHGTISGDRVRGRWWDVPKHARTTTGAVELQISQGGDRLVRKSADRAIGVSVLTRISPASVAWPRTDRDAGFQTTQNTDLDGKFLGKNGARYYLRETNDAVVGIGELREGSNERPTWATVLVGRRTSNGAIGGQAADVPKGRRSVSGSMALARISGTRDHAFAMPNAGPDTLRPDYAVDFERMRTLIDQGVRGGVIGYGFSVTKHDRIVAEGAGGFRRLGQDDPTGGNVALRFNVTTQNETASTTKLVTAAMVMRTLDEKGFSLDAKVSGTLPSCWTKGPGIIGHSWGLTFRQLLGHTSRLVRFSACDDNPYECLRQAIEAGRVGPATDATGNPRQYQNLNYTIFRYILPGLRDKPAVERIFDKYDCKRGNGARINAEMSELYRRYVSDEVLAPLGVTGTFEPVTEFAIRYDFSQPRAPGIRPSYQDVLETGSGGMKWSAREYGEFLAALETGKIVAPSTLRTMRSELLGYDALASGTPGNYPWKNGGTDGIQSWTMSFPSGIAAFITVNSDNNNLGGRNLGQILRDAFDASIR